VDRQRRLPAAALIPLVLLAAYLTACRSIYTPSARVLPITSANRNYPGIMFGGWGPHLRALMRNSRDQLWFVTDVGPDVQHNEEVVYHRFDGSRWSEIARLKQMPGIQQNVASVMSGDTIFSYGISVREPLYVEECKFNTKTKSEPTCAPLEIDGRKLLLPPSCNYVGAAVSPSGKKLVWWTTVGVNGGEGKWSYIFERGGSWVGPVVSSLKTFNDFGYVFASFSTDDHVSVAGQFFAGAYPHGTYALGCAEFNPGDELDLTKNFHAFSTNWSDYGKSAADVWVHNGTTHVIAETQHGTLAYYCRAVGKTWLECDKPICILTNVHRARFVECGRNIYLICGSANGIGLSIRRSKASNGPIDWARIAPLNLGIIEQDFRAPSAVYVESRSYQTAPVKKPNVAVVGHYPEADSKILHVQLP
jgi:hypothetical protein